MGAGTSMIASGAGATVSTAMGIAQYYQGKKMIKKAEELEKTAAAQRPTYAIPSEVEGYLSTAQKMAMQGMGEQERQRYLDQIARNSAYAMAGNVDRQSGLQGVAQGNMAMNDANANLMVMDNQQKQQNIQNLQNARLLYGNYQDKAFAYNKDQPYQDMAAAIRALKGAGEQAKYAGSVTVANAGSNFAGQAGQAMSTINTQPQETEYTYESVNSPYYTGYGRREQMNTIGTPQSVTSPYVTPQSSQVNTQTTNAPTANPPTYEQWLASQNSNPYYVK